MSEYREIYEQLLKRVESGEFPVGSALPSISALMDEYDVNSLSTIRAAQQMLVQDGLLRTEQGRGAFVIATESPRKVDPREAIAEAMFHLQRAQRAVIANTVRKLTIDLDDEPTYFVLHGALRKYSDHTRALAETEQDVERAALLGGLADEADRLSKQVDDSFSDTPVEGSGTDVGG